MRVPTEAAAAAIFLSSALRSQKQVREFAVECGCPIGADPEPAAMEAARMCLQQRGINVSAAAVELSQEARGMLERGMWQSDFPADEVFQFYGETHAESAAIVAENGCHSCGGIVRIGRPASMRSVAATP